MCLDHVFMVFAVLHFLELLMGCDFFFCLDLFIFTVSSVYLPLSCCSNYYNQTSESLKVECCQHNVWKSSILIAKIATGISGKLIATL